MDDRIVKLLLIEDNPNIASLIRKVLDKGNGNAYELEWVDCLSLGLERLSKEKFDILLLDLNLSDSEGLDTFRKVHAHGLQIPTIILSAIDNETLAVEALKMGAQDYLVKGQFDMLLLARLIRYAVVRYENQEELKRTKGALALSEGRFRNMVEKNADGIIIVDSCERVRFVNPAAEVILGRKAAELQGQLFGFPAVGVGTTEIEIVRRDREIGVAEMRVVEMEWEGEYVYLTSLRDITERKRAEEERKIMILQIQEALEKVRTLSGLLPICSFCKKIRDDNGYWNRIETYIAAHSGAEFSHTMCEECARKHYPEFYNDKTEEES